MLEILFYSSTLKGFQAFLRIPTQAPMWLDNKNLFCFPNKSNGLASPSEICTSNLQKEGKTKMDDK